MKGLGVGGLTYYESATVLLTRLVLSRERPPPELAALARKQHVLVVADEVMGFRYARGERTGIRTT